ncbi:uncharacterized protein B0I36DRAFT_388133 [Microdochium trichocladiopsis]|uniref:Hydrophobic surface binding protein A-domain-containing protein n=1 Tax=Microdochium trichocladiopsis TaxID=1682393 RepID=A0A9P8XWG7_9PEZI|nr:uncharacterized protein B0I36DRAFT_388133 [Microdochium trichocladiopsis]KAH7021424.1 hypothetical protein B0I36DRAFT_388133 [Microdochium trichocladiopsis]
MRTISAFTIAMAILMPATILATVVHPSSSASSPYPDDDDTMHATALLEARQNLGTTLSQLSDLVSILNQIVTSLKPQFFEDMSTLITGLADLMAAPLPAQLRGLINTATDLLGGLGPVLRFIGKIDFASLTESAQGLFEPQFVADRVKLMKDVSGLITTQFIQKVVDVVDELAPLIAAVSQFITALIASFIG